MSLTWYQLRSGANKSTLCPGALRNFKQPLKRGASLLVSASAALCLSGPLFGQQQSGGQGAQINGSAHIGFGNPDLRYSQYWKEVAGSDAEVAGRPSGPVKLAETYSLFAWKGETVSMQLLIQAPKDLTALKVTPTAIKLLKAADGSAVKAGKHAVIKADAVEVGYLRYVLSNGIGKSGSGCGIDTSVQHQAHIVADGIDYGASTIQVAAGRNQPVWVKVRVPAGAVPGVYQGQLEVAYKSPGSDRQKSTFHYQLEVKNRTLPVPAKWSFHLDLWQYPGSIARWYKVKPWSKEHFAKMRPYMQMLADAGQKVITASIINDPWNGQTYDPYTSMVKWTKKRDGSWVYDYTIFDKWVSYMMGLGIDQQINCYSMVPWHNTFAYYDEASGTDKKLIAKPGTAAYDEFWKGMLEDFAKHLKTKGWFDKTCIAMDERPLEAMEKVILLVKGLPQPFKLSLAGSYHKTLDKEIYDYSITTREHYDPDVLTRRLAAGLPTTYYTCCSEDHPNTFSFSPPAEAAFIPLLSASRNLTGYLRWAFNAWPEHPLTDTRFGSWSSGDTYFVYPGPGSSIRYEQLIRGIQDFEKIRIIKADLAAANNSAELQKLNEALADCTVDNLRKEGAAQLVSAVEEVIHRF